MNVLYELIYVSASRRSLLSVELADLLRKARVRNTAAGISGMLLFKEGAFLQILEGDEPKVTETFTRIERDRRHHRVLRLFGGPIERRSFGEWSMGFVDGHDPSLARFPGFTDFLKSGWSNAATSSRSDRVSAIATQFRDGRWRQAVLPALR